MHFLGRGWTFDYLEEATAICANTNCHFSKDFISWGSDTLFEEYAVELADDQSTTSAHQHALSGCGTYCIGKDPSFLGKETSQLEEELYC
jgi:hypothetical protein